MDVVTVVDAELRALADPVRAANERRYLKSDLVHLGVPVPAIRKITARAVREAKPGDTLAIAAALWAATEDGSPVHEMRMAAIEVLTRGVRGLGPADLPVAERMVRESRTWAYVDALATRVIGDLVRRHPKLAVELDRFAGDENFWIRRTALLALLPGIRVGAGDLGRLSRYGDLLIEEKEFFIRKALGWVLRELSKRDPEWVRAWVAGRIGVISGVTIREAVRHLPPSAREGLRTAYKSRTP
jgi:3-methyladenine DNA glycosylase AlkD